MLAFLDTEFTDLGPFPRLLSLGLVTESATVDEFYAEVTDRERIQAASCYAQRQVLPQFGRIAGGACSYRELGTRLCTFVMKLAEALHAGEILEVAFGYHVDWELLKAAIVDSDDDRWKSARSRIFPLNVYEFTGFDAGRLASDGYFQSQAMAPLSRHHALCDARALRLAYQASTSEIEASRRRPRVRQSQPLDFGCASMQPAKA